MSTQHKKVLALLQEARDSVVAPRDGYYLALRTIHSCHTVGGGAICMPIAMFSEAEPQLLEYVRSTGEYIVRFCIKVKELIGSLAEKE